MANDSLAHHLLLPLAAGCCSDVDDDDEPANVAFPSFWPPFPALSPGSDSGAASFVRPRMDRPRRREAAASSAFFGLGFHDGDDDEWAPPDEADGEVELPLCWDCLQLEDHDDHRRWGVGVSDADEWEQAAGRDEEEANAVRSLEWEVLLAANSLGSLVVGDAGGGGGGGDDDELDAGVETYFLDDADDLLFGQLAAAEAGHEPPGKGGRPAAKAAVEALPTVVAAEAGGAQCAVCKDAVVAGERARRLPCAHLYHDGCILPWLAIRNTCPLCRHELPTDDPEYEKWKARRGDADTRGAAAATATVMRLCADLGVIYHCCSPRLARKPTKQYLKDTAYEILKEINEAVQYDTQDEDSEKDFHVGSDVEIEEVDSWDEDDVSEQLDSFDHHIIEESEDHHTIEESEDHHIIDGCDEETQESEGSEPTEDDDDLDAGVETYFLDDADDLLFGQLEAAETDHEPPAKRGRPAAKAAVEALPTVVAAEAGGAQCAVCNDGVVAGERARRLPCAHLYHDGCILPWLAICNTCPLCRHELPTDDPDGCIGGGTD